MSRLLARTSARVAGATVLAAALAVGGLGVARLVSAHAAGTSGTARAVAASALAGSAQSPNGSGRAGGWHGGGRPDSVGTVTSVSSSGNPQSFVLKEFDGSSVTVDVSATTKYTDRGVSSPSFADLKVNQHVAAGGTSSSGTLTATRVVIMPAGGFKAGDRGFLPGTAGTVTSVSSPGNPQSFVVKAFDGSSVTVDVSATTKYTDPGVSSPSFADLKVNQYVAASGTSNSGTLTATRVMIMPAGGFKGGDHQIGLPGFGGGGAKPPV